MRCLFRGNQGRGYQDRQPFAGSMEKKLEGHFHSKSSEFDGTSTWTESEGVPSPTVGPKA